MRLLFYTKNVCIPNNHMPFGARSDEECNNCHQPDGETPPYIPVSAITRRTFEALTPNRAAVFLITRYPFDEDPSCA